MATADAPIGQYWFRATPQPQEKTTVRHRTHPKTPRIAAAVTSLTAVCLFGATLYVATSLAAAHVAVARTNLVENGGFEQSLSGWGLKRGSSSYTLARSQNAHRGSFSAQLSATAPGALVLRDLPRVVGKSDVDARYIASAWVRAPQANHLRVAVRVKERSGRVRINKQVKTVTLGDSEWHRVRLSYSRLLAVPSA